MLQCSCQERFSRWTSFLDMFDVGAVARAVIVSFVGNVFCTRLSQGFDKFIDVGHRRFVVRGSVHELQWAYCTKLEYSW